METGKNKNETESKNEEPLHEEINLNNYAGDEEDNKAAREQSGRYVQDLDRNLNEKTGTTTTK
jgi:hypothetical protein